MNDVSIAMAKLAGIQKSVRSALTEDQGRNPGGIPQYARSFKPSDVGYYFTQAALQLEVLKNSLPEWFGDFPVLSSEPEMQMIATAAEQKPMHFSRAQLERLSRDIDHLFEIRANCQPAPTQRKEPVMRTFISHGRSKDWYEVQAHLERDLLLKTMELAQEPSKGQTIVEKLEINSDQCDSAVIVMSGDDADDGGQIRVRENVMHEIGFFQAKYGRHRVILLHEEGVNVPTNLSGIVYVAYPKGLVAATFGVLDRELKAIYRL